MASVIDDQHALDLRGSVVLVTGAAGGIGRDMAHLLAASGSSVVLVDRDADPLAAAHAELVAEGGTAASYQADLADAQSVGNLVDQVSTEVGLIRGLVSAAGIHATVPFLEIDPTQLRQMLQVNLEATMFIVQEIGRRLLAEDVSGSMVLLASLSGRAPRPVHAHYAASKAGVVSIAQSAAAALAPRVRVNAICPGTIETPMLERSLADQKDAEQLGGKENRNFLNQSPARALLGRHGKPRDISNAVAFLLSDKASFITGQALNVDGGVLFN